MKKHILVLLIAAMLLTGCQKAEPEGTGTLPAAVETTLPTAATLPTPEETTSFSFGDLKEWEFLFASGAGSWGTWVYIGEDGSFSGEYCDHDNITGEGYPNGTMSWCNFSGSFTQPVQLDPYVYSFSVGELHYEAEVGTEEIRDGMLYAASDSYGLALGEEFLLYLPGIPLEELPEEYLYWSHVSNDPPADGKLPFYGLYSPVNQTGFSSSKQSACAGELKALEDQASALEEKLLTDGTLSQGDMNSLAAEIYRLWDDELNRLWGLLKEVLDKDTMAELTREQLQWIQDKEAAVAAAGAEAEGGSLQPLLEADKAAELTRERVYYLAQFLS